MKKRLLITSIVMMLVVAVALSTATYAWFTSNNSVTANSVTMTAHVADASSISIGWEDGTSGTTLAAVAGENLYPMCPIVLSGTNANTVAFNRAEVKSNGNFDTPTSATPYTWISATTSGKDVFYINNDSPAQTVSVSVSATIRDIANAPLSDATVLTPGTTYYTWSETSTAGLYAATKITTFDYSSGDKTVANAKSALNVTAIYDKKPIGNYVRVAIFASDAQNTKTEVLAKTAFTYKGLLGQGDGSTNDTAMGEITANTDPTTTVGNKIASDDSVLVISSLGGNKAVYLIVKVWVDGQSFTQAEGLAQATVELNFTANPV